MSEGKAMLRAADSIDVISEQGIRAALGGYAGEIHVHEVLESTNKTAKELALGGAAHGSVVIANAQTAGRGRMGRSFYSPPDCGVYMSVILRPKGSVMDGTLVTTLASVAVCRAIETTTGKKPKIKWVNDLLLNGKKVCGILAEGVVSSDGGLDFAVLGIGINFSNTLVPPEIAEIVGSLQAEKLTTRNRLIAEILAELAMVMNESNTYQLIVECKKRSAVLGRDIDIHCNGEVTAAKAIDISGNGGLVVRFEDGTQQILIYGEVSIRGEFKDD